GVRETVPGMGGPLLIEAETGKVSGNLWTVWDGNATGNMALGPYTLQPEAGQAAFEVEVPASGSYILCCRINPESARQTLALKIDDGQARESSIAPAQDYTPYVLGPFSMAAGKHALTLTVPKPGLRLDFLELMPSAPAVEGKP